MIPPIGVRGARVSGLARWRLVFVVGLGVTVSGGLSLWAAPAHAEDKAAAKDHWERGTKFYDLGKYDDAIREFEAAYEAKSDPAFLYNLAQSHRLAGHNTEALRLYRNYLRYAPKAPNRADIEERIKELEKHAGDSPTTAPPPATTPPPGATGPTTAGPTTPSSPPPEAAPPSTPAGGTTGAWTSTPPPGATVPANGTSPSGTAPAGTAAVATATPGTGGATSPRSGRRTAGLAIAGAGVGLFVVGAIFGGVAKAQSKKVEDAAKAGDRFDPSVEKLGKNAQALQWVGYVLGTVGIATGIVLYATAPRPESAAPRVAVAPLVSPAAGGALVQVTF